MLGLIADIKSAAKSRDAVFRETQALEAAAVSATPKPGSVQRKRSFKGAAKGVVTGIKINDAIELNNFAPDLFGRMSDARVDSDMVEAIERVPQLAGMPEAGVDYITVEDAAGSPAAGSFGAGAGGAYDVGDEGDTDDADGWGGIGFGAIAEEEFEITESAVGRRTPMQPNGAGESIESFEALMMQNTGMSMPDAGEGARSARFAETLPVPVRAAKISKQWWRSGARLLRAPR